MRYGVLLLYNIILKQKMNKKYFVYSKQNWCQKNCIVPQTMYETDEGCVYLGSKYLKIYIPLYTVTHRNILPF